jgi:very-short-patch-repair endonuclease
MEFGSEAHSEQIPSPRFNGERVRVRGKSRMRGPKPETTSRARSLRQSDNDAEWKFWLEVRNRRLNGLKFVRQEPIGSYFADFVCREVRLVVELDGSQHAESRYDERRNAFMNEQGWSVARFWSADFLQNKDQVLETIVAICDGRLVETVRSYDFQYFPAQRG